MNRSDFVLAALAGAGENTTFTPAQIQKFFFLLDREGSQILGGPYFNFQPYDYGPFDRVVYEEVDGLSKAGAAQVMAGRHFREYGLTAGGAEAGLAAFEALDDDAKDYIRSVAKWVKSRTFSQLVSAIYAKYPDMKVNSIFRQ